MCTISTYFNPLPPHGGRLHTGVNFVDCFLFQSTPSAWRETCYFLYLLYHAEHFNPLPPHGGRQWRKCTSVYGCGISIHSLRMEGDLERRQKRTGVRYFNPLPPHGGRQVICVSVIIVFLFQSTPSAWRETCYNTLKKSIQGISIHSLRMEGDLFSIVLSKSPNCISIHSLRMEGDVAVQIGHAAVSLSFQSTPSAWRETFPPFKSGDAFLISIHSLRMEGDH